MEALFLGSHPAMDFLNTTFTPEGALVEVIGDGESFLRWLVDAQLLAPSDAARLKRLCSSKALDACARHARKVRTWAAEWIERWSNDPRAPYSVELNRLNALLERSHSFQQINRAGASLEITRHEHLLDPSELLGLIAYPLAQLMTNEDPKLVKRCAGTGCTLWFLDRTKAHRRLFCSAAACGNRAKVAAFRERRRK